MVDTNNCSRAIRCVTVLLGLLLAFSGTACNSGPTEPTWDDLIRLYTGKWRGNINGLEVDLDVQATQGDLIGLGGTGTARNPATGKSHSLELFGQATGLPWLMVYTANEIGPGGLLVSSGKHTGEFRGNVPRDGRTWPGHWISTTRDDGAPIFGPSAPSVTLIKE